MSNLMKAMFFPQIRYRKELVILLFIFSIHAFLRFYGMEDRHGFTLDQIENAWVAKDIIVDGKMPLVGMVAKQNSGFYIGPLYYYYVAFFYFLTQLDPIASIYIAGFTSTITFFVFFLFIRKLFSESVALVALFINAVSAFSSISDRVQWPIGFLAPISIVIFYLLFQILLGKINKNIIYLAIALGLSWQLNFTAIFFFIITLLSLPFFPRIKETLRESLLAIPILITFFIPNIIYDLLHKSTSSLHMSHYLTEYYHGFHLTRMLQLARDAFIEFSTLFNHPYLQALRYVFVPLFFLLYLHEKKNKERFLLCYLVALWFLVPWLVFTMYRGEISNYYFSMTRPIVLMIMGYIIVWVFRRNIFFLNALTVFLLGVYAIYGIRQIFIPTYRPLSLYRRNAEEKITAGKKIDFSPYTPESYIYNVSNKYDKNSK